MLAAWILLLLEGQNPESFAMRLPHTLNARRQRSVPLEQEKAKEQVRETLKEDGEGVLHSPSWLPRSFRRGWTM